MLLTLGITFKSEDFISFKNNEIDFAKKIEIFYNIIYKLKKKTT